MLQSPFESAKDAAPITDGGLSADQAIAANLDSAKLLEQYSAVVGSKQPSLSGDAEASGKMSFTEDIYKTDKHYHDHAQFAVSAGGSSASDGRSSADGLTSGQQLAVINRPDSTSAVFSRVSDGVPAEVSSISGSIGNSEKVSSDSSGAPDVDAHQQYDAHSYLDNYRDGGDPIQNLAPELVSLLEKIGHGENDSRLLIGAEVALLAVVMSAVSIRKSSPEEMAQQLMKSQTGEDSMQGNAWASITQGLNTLKGQTDQPWFQDLVRKAIGSGAMEQLLGTNQVKSSAVAADCDGLVGRTSAEQKTGRLQTKTPVGESGEFWSKLQLTDSQAVVTVEEALAEHEGFDSSEDHSHSVQDKAAAEQQQLLATEGWLPSDDTNVKDPPEVTKNLKVKRPTWLVRPNEDLVKLAEHLFHDASIGWLIASLNKDCTVQTEIEDKCLVELRVRQRIQIPVWQDIVQFRKSALQRRNANDLLTVVRQTRVERELMDNLLAPAMGVAVIAQSDSAPSGKEGKKAREEAESPLPDGSFHERCAAFRRNTAAKIARLLGGDNDRFPGAGAILTDAVWINKPTVATRSAS